MVPFNFLLGSVVLVSSLMVVSSTNWLGMWIALELNSLALIPFIKGKGAGKYFLAQSLGSALILAGPALGNDLLVIVGAGLKAGVAPLHLWFPQVMSCISWPACFVLSTWQKVAPLAILLSVSDYVFLVVLSSASAIFGCLGALKQSSLRGVIGYSSITHMGWIMGGATAGVMYAITYLLVYVVVSFFLISSLSKFNFSSNTKQDLSVVWLLYSMAGLPPFVGFFPKLWILFGCTSAVATPLVLSSIVMLYVYSSIAFSSLTLSKLQSLGAPSFILLSFPWVLI